VDETVIRYILRVKNLIILLVAGVIYEGSSTRSTGGGQT